MSEPQAPVAGSLAELGIGVIKQLADLADKGAGSADDLRARWNELFIDFENRGQRQGKAVEDVRLAKYAFVALIDETILLSDLPVKDDWLSRPLQMQYFDDFSAGEEFYNKLDALRVARGPGVVEVLEVYYLCLALGFTGKYGDKKGLERRKVIMDNLANDIGQARGVSAKSPLSVRAEPGPVAKAGGPSLLGRAPFWPLPVAVALGLALTWFLAEQSERAALADLGVALQADQPDKPDKAAKPADAAAPAPSPATQGSP